MALRAGRVGVRRDQVDGQGYITGSGGGGGQTAGHTFSTTEQVIGKWIDGKPIYELTLELSNNRASLGDIQVDTVIDISAFPGEDSGNVWTISTVSGLNNRAAVYTPATNEVAVLGGYPVSYIVIKYTKKEV